jgi:ferrous iron transport protein A
VPKWFRGGGRWGWRGPGFPGGAQAWPSPPVGGSTLASTPPGSRVVVKSILAGWGATSRLAGLGIAPGVVVEVVSNDMIYPWTPVIIRIRGVEVAIGRGIASRIIVEPVK